MAGEQPDPAFKAFFAGEWKALMDAVTVPGMPYASWDRKAAYLLWVMIRDTVGGTDAVKLAIRMNAGQPKPGTIRTELDPTEVAQAVDDFTANHLWMKDRPAPVGTWPVNPSDDDAGPPSPGGVSLEFDSAKFKW